jgi:hypothetical protein
MEIHAPDHPIGEWRGQIRSALAALTFQEQMARALLKRYDELLADK